MVYAVTTTRDAADICLDEPKPHYSHDANILGITGWANPMTKKIVVCFDTFTISCSKTIVRRDVSAHLLKLSIPTTDDVHGFSVKAPLEPCSIYSVDDLGSKTL